jgi:hypothetical protein
MRWDSVVPTQDDAGNTAAERARCRALELDDPCFRQAMCPFVPMGRITNRQLDDTVAIDSIQFFDLTKRVVGARHIDATQ